nr:hypothetical protein [Tanacetum cinerariifolium]
MVFKPLKSENILNGFEPKTLVKRIRALVDGKRVIINEASIRYDLKLDDAKEKAKIKEETKVSQTKPQTEEHVPTPSNDPLPYGEDRLQVTELMELCTKLSNMVLSLEQIKTNQAAKIEKQNKRVKKLEAKRKKRTHGLKRMHKIGLSTMIVSFDKKGLGDQEDASKQRRIAEIDDDKDLSFVDETVQDQERIINKDEMMFDMNVDLQGEDVVVDKDAENLSSKDKGKAKMLEPKKPLKKKAQIQADQELAHSYNNADKLLAEQLQAQEREQLSIEERSKLLAELIKSRRKYFAVKRAKEIRNKPLIKAQQKSLMCTYLKNIEGYKQKDFKGRSFDTIKKMSDKTYKRVNTFMAIELEGVEGSKKNQAEVTKGSSKRAGDKLEQECAKRQRLEKEDDSAELQKCLK